MEDVLIRFRPGIPGLIPDAWIVVPVEGRSTPPVVAIHGITRNVEEMAEALMPRVRDTGRTLVIPIFQRSQFKRYQLARCNQRADLALLRLMQELRRERLVSDSSFDLSGFSGGGQFAHRFAWLYPNLVGNLCVTAPGWWTFPDQRVSWPYGIGRDQGSDRQDVQSFRLSANLRRFLDRQITVCVGAEDIEHDANLRRGAEIDAQQGRNRLQRARNWSEAAKTAAIGQGVSHGISFRILQGCGHSLADCVEKGGLDAFFVPRATFNPQLPQSRETPTLDLVKRTAA